MRTLRLAGLEVQVTGGSDGSGAGPGPVLVLLHGFGAPGDDLVPLADALDIPPRVRCVFPAAPLTPPEFAAYGGRAWWPLDTVELQRALAEGRMRDRSRETPPGMAEASAQVIGMLDALEQDPELRVTGEGLILGGFSQGAMLACDVALRTQRPLAGLVLLSTTLLCKDVWQPLMAARKGLPVLQTHGLQDPLLPHAMAVELRDMLLAAGAALQWLEFRGGHEVPTAVLDALAGFIRQHG